MRLVSWFAGEAKPAMLAEAIARPAWLLGGSSLAYLDGPSAAIDCERRKDATGRRAHQPECGRRPAAGMLDQPGRGEWRERAEHPGGQRERQREAGCTDVRR